MSWKRLRFSDLFDDPKRDIISGPFGSNLKATEYVPDGIPLVRLQNVDRGEFLNKNIKYITPRKAEELASHRYEPGDILISKLGDPLGKACIVPDNVKAGVIMADIVRARLRSGRALREFVVLQLNSAGVIEQLKSQTKGSTRPRVNLENIRDLEVDVPPLPEQQRIVGKLDAAFAALTEAQAHVERNRANARELFESGLAEALTSLPEDEDPHALDSLLVPGRKISYGIVKPGVHDPNGVRLIKSQQVRNGEMDLSADFRITKKLDEEYARTRLLGGEILLNLVGASIGRSAVAPIELRGANVSRAIAVIPVVPELTEWVQYNLRGAVGQKLIQSRTGGSAQPVLNLSEVKALTIPMPSADKRKAILKRLDSFTSSATELETTYQQKLSDLVGLKKAVLGAAFRGEL
jgi:type I restriction enzyme, S subunit